MRVCLLPQVRCEPVNDILEIDVEHMPELADVVLFSKFKFICCLLPQVRGEPVTEILEIKHMHGLADVVLFAYTKIINCLLPQVRGEPVSEILEIDIKPGWKKGTKITFQEKGKSQGGPSPRVQGKAGAGAAAVKQTWAGISASDG